MVGTRLKYSDVKQWYTRITCRTLYKGILRISCIVLYLEFPHTKGQTKCKIKTTQRTQKTKLFYESSLETLIYSLPAEPQGKPRNIGVDSLSLLQWIFTTQESNQGLLHCRQFLYQLSYEGSPIYSQGDTNRQQPQKHILLT